MKPILLLALGGALALSACGGSSRQVAGIDGGGTPAPVAGVVSKGTITGFGSVKVNGVTYNTSSTLFTIDGNPGLQSDLAVGQVIVVKGTLNDDTTTGTATNITFEDAVEGPIGSIDPVAGTLVVLGQLLRVDADTSFDDSINPASLVGLGVGDIVEVSGFFLADGSINATRIEAKPAGLDFELTGIVSNVAATTFEINGFVVDFSSAMLENFPGGSPENGQPVEAKGSTLGGAGELLATRVEFKSGDLGDDGDRAELEGFITRFDAATPTDFDVEGVPVMTNGQTVFESGTSADLALNRKVEVEGVINAAGVLVATKVELKTAGSIRIESLVEAMSADQLTVLGIVIRVNASTRYEDKSNAAVVQFDIDDVSVGDYVEVRGFEDNGEVVATLLERENFSNEVALRGFVAAVNDPEFTILGTMITTDGTTTFTDRAGVAISSVTFFAQANGRLVEAEGTLNGSTLNAVEVEFED